MLADIAFVLCLAMIAIGAGLIFMPAGLIVAGALGAWSLLRAAKSSPPPTPGDGS